MSTVCPRSRNTHRNIQSRIRGSKIHSVELMCRGWEMFGVSLYAIAWIRVNKDFLKSPGRR